jgi:hypothetical protein
MFTLAANRSDEEGQLYSDDVFSTYLYTGNGSTQTITNGIDLAGKGGLVWIKSRNISESNVLYDTARGINQQLQSQNIDGSSNSANTLTAFNSTGFTLGTNRTASTVNFASWTFREAAKFFDVVTWTGTGSARTIAHSLGVAPGMIIVKRTDTTGNWQVYSNGLTSAAYSMQLNLIATQTSAPNVWNSTAPTSSVFSVGTDATVNASGGTYVAYLFAHDTSSTGIIQCGSFTTDGSGNATVNLGWEPQWIITSASSGGGDYWRIWDTMRGWPNNSTGPQSLFANTSSVESAYGGLESLNATGFGISGFNTATYIYMAIRMPNKPPTTGTQVFSPLAYTGNGSLSYPLTGVGFSPDFVFLKGRTVGWAPNWNDKLRGATKPLNSASTATEQTSNSVMSFDMAGFTLGDESSTNSNTYTYIAEVFKRAPGFFDVVCYTGDGTSNPARSINHSLGVKPEFVILKSRSDSGNWLSVVNIGSSYVYSSAVSNFGFNLTSFPAANAFLGTTYVSATAFQLGFLVPDIDVSATQRDKVNANNATYVAYLFATLAGISKVGSYTGNGSSQNIECGFAAGARFVLIKCTSTTGDWYVWDTARGIVTGNDPHLSLNTAVAEVTADDSIDPYSPGFTVNQVAATNINVASATYIFLAIA